MEVQLSTIDLVRLQKGVKTVGCRSRWFNQEISLHRLIVYDRMTERRLSRLRSLVTELPALAPGLGLLVHLVRWFKQVPNNLLCSISRSSKTCNFSLFHMFVVFVGGPLPLAVAV